MYNIYIDNENKNASLNRESSFNFVYHWQKSMKILDIITLIPLLVLRREVDIASGLQENVFDDVAN